MPRAVSIHIGVNRPLGHPVPLQYSEPNAWRMAELASQAGYQSLLVLRGEGATQQAVHDALTGAAGSLAAGDVLLVSFSGHGSQHPDKNCDDRDGCDESWCLADGPLVDDKLLGYWRLFEPGVRVVVVSESCYGGGVGRDDEGMPVRPAPAPAYRVMRDGGSGYRPVDRSAEAADYAGSCIGAPPRCDDGIRASLLLLSASREEQPARENLYMRHLLHVWNDGAFRGSYCDLHRTVRQRVIHEHGTQEPQILMLGAADPDFPLETAFHLDRRGARRSAVYR